MYAHAADMGKEQSKFDCMAYPSQESRLGLTEGFYDYWRDHVIAEAYLLHDSNHQLGFHYVNFIQTSALSLAAYS